MAELNQQDQSREPARTTSQLRKQLQGRAGGPRAEKQEKVVRRFKLLAGKHVALDPTLGTDERGRGQSRIYRRGETVESDKDLVALFGSEKFQLIGERQASVRAGVPFPQGQMPTGFQATEGSGQRDPLDGRIHQAKAEDAETQAKLTREGGSVPAQEGDTSIPLATEGAVLSGREAAEAEGGGAEEREPATGDDGLEPGSDEPGPAYDLEAMSLRDLRELAEANEVDLEGAGNSKEKVKERLRQRGF